MVNLLKGNPFSLAPSIKESATVFHCLFMVFGSLKRSSLRKGRLVKRIIAGMLLLFSIPQIKSTRTFPENHDVMA
jgi:hypothetical protein